MSIPLPRKKQLTGATAVAFVVSVGVVSAFPSPGTHSLLALSGLSFLLLYASG